MHSYGRLHFFRGSCIWVASARCVKPLPLLEGLTVFLAFRALLVVLSPLPLLEGYLCFTWLRRAVACVFGDQVLLISNDPVLAFLWLLVIWVSSLFSLLLLFLLLKLFVCWCWQCTHQEGDYKYKIDMCPYSSFCDEWLSTWSTT
jgi:hypothetical protein